MRENKNFEIGNFNKATKELEEELSSPQLSPKEKISLNKKIEYSKTFYQNLIPQTPGEAYFPVIDNVNGYDRILTLKVVNRNQSKFSTSDFYKSWEFVKNLIAGFLDRKLHSSDILSAVLDWKFENVGIEIVKPHNKFDFEINDIAGNSMQLAMGVAFVSFLMNEKIPGTYAFSGSLSPKINGISINDVENIERKRKIISEEKKEVTDFITVNEFDDFEKLIDKIFGKEYLNEIVKNLKNKIPLSDVTIFSLQILKNVPVFLSSRNVQTKATIYRFNNVNFPEQKFTLLNDFFEKISRNTNDNSIIIDNLRPNFATGMIMPKFLNKISGFVALNYPQTESKIMGYENSAIVIYKSRTNNDVREGEIIYFQKK